jgi:outer membrane protein assembly factor BamB
MYHDGRFPCYGGVLVLDGRTGQILWQHWTEEGVYALDCSADVTGDGTNDCLATGKKGVSQCVVEFEIKNYIDSSIIHPIKFL